MTDEIPGDNGGLRREITCISPLVLDPVIFKVIELDVTVKRYELYLPIGTLGAGDGLPARPY